MKAKSQQEILIEESQRYHRLSQDLAAAADREAAEAKARAGN